MDSLCSITGLHCLCPPLIRVCSGTRGIYHRNSSRNGFMADSKNQDRKFGRGCGIIFGHFHDYMPLPSKKFHYAGTVKSKGALWSFPIMLAEVPLVDTKLNNLFPDNEGAAKLETVDRFYSGRKRTKRSSICATDSETEGSIALPVKIGGILSNAKRFKDGIMQRGSRCSLGIDLGDVRTGVAASRGYVPRPISVVNLRGEKLQAYLLRLAKKEGADEFILGLPRTWDEKETTQSNKVRSFAGRLAFNAAQQGWRVYLQDEHGTSEDALQYMIDMGLSKWRRRQQLDAYAAVMLLESYFSNDGRPAELVLPKDPILQKQLCEGP